MRVVLIYKVNDFSPKKSIAIRIPFCFVFFEHIGFTFIATIYSDISLSVIVNGPLNSTLFIYDGKEGGFTGGGLKFLFQNRHFRKANYFSIAFF